MSSSNWDSAVIKSIGYVGIGIAIWSLFNGLAPSSLNDIFGLAVTFLLYIGVYLIISIVGWLVVGFPVHWFVKKYTNGSYAFYIAIPLIIVVGGLFNNSPKILGLAALFQALLFRYYLYKKT
ncbi:MULTISPECIES: hypothetical protein [Alteromonadales]|uniref:hypothetical protein n=1 Tax=Alteromonadales TaxID=135622 RepID=UPI001FD3D8BC|nr:MULTISPECIES: hypothetical protein [Alteromonadales]MCL1115428.1 hypothetical protein [Shewanella basaltis]